MIYLLTGTPGTGKTAFLIDSYLKNKFGLFTDENNNPRPIFCVNLKIIDKKTLPFSEVSAEDFMSKPLHDNFEDGSVIIVDEASEIYPVRAAASKLPSYIEGLNTLRHHGLTLFVLTQSPTMIDIFVRNLVGKHWHIDRKQLGSKFYEWNKCVVSPSKSYFAEAYSELYKPNSDVFGLYESSTKHIKFKKSLSWHYKAIPFLIVFIIFCFWYVFSSFTSLAESEKNNESVQSVSSVENANPTKSSFFDSRSIPVSMSEDDYKPRISGKEESAPIYDGVRKVVDFPKIVGCVMRDIDKTNKICTCYSQQGSPLRYVSVRECVQFLANRPFNPYISPNDEFSRDNNQKENQGNVSVVRGFRG